MKRMTVLTIVLAASLLSGCARPGGFWAQDRLATSIQSNGETLGIDDSLYADKNGSPDEGISLEWEFDTSSLPALMLSAFELLREQEPEDSALSVMLHSDSGGTSVMVDDGDTFVSCQRHTGGSTTEGQVGVTALSYRCDFSTSYWPLSTRKLSTQAVLYMALEALHESHLDAGLESPVVTSGFAYELQTDQGLLSCFTQAEVANDKGELALGYTCELSY